MPGGLTLLASSAATIPTPAAGKVTIFFNTDTGLPSYKDDAGVVHTLTGPTGATGAQGPAGVPGFAELPIDPDYPIALMGPQGNTGPTGPTGASGPAGSGGTIAEDILYPEDIMHPPGVTTPPPGAGPWVLTHTSSPSGVAQVDFTNLAGYSDIRVVLVGVTFGSGSACQLRVSTDNGATFLSASGDYVTVSGEGAIANATELRFYSTAATAARSSQLMIYGINVAAPKWAQGIFFTTDSVGFRYMPTTSQINAVRVLNSSAVNFTGGTIYVFGR